MMNLNTGIISNHLRYIEPCGGKFHLAILEFQPQVFTFGWSIKCESNVFGHKKFEYKKVKIAFPYLFVIIPVFSGKIGQTPVFYSSGEQLLFSNEPLTSRKFKASPAPLLNCLDRNVIYDQENLNKAKKKPLVPEDLHPKTIDLKEEKKVFSACLSRDAFANWPKSIAESIAITLERIMYDNFNTDYNESFTNFFVYRKPQLYPIENWVKNTTENPNFIMDINWSELEFTF